ncbi:aminoglycoside phosphotransferase family protein [Novosphingobium sp.]|uniref:aminoglycoside phosphotransferase family protein n=1 Tax=Novosphingobium sp. TaxID=1874826 RepID=UPI003B5196FB
MAMNIPDGAAAFLASKGWAGATIDPLPGDASFRRYFRVHKADGQGSGKAAMLMHAPPPREDPEPFLRAARWLDDNALRPPHILGEDVASGFVLLEDFGDVRMREYVDEWPDDEAEVYRVAISALVQIHRLPAGPFNDYTLSEYLRETRLFLDWYCPARGLYVDGRTWTSAWEAVLAPLIPRQRPGVTVLRDYHAENIMLLGGVNRQGLLDFQDALTGHPAYDLVSLLQDARRDVSPELETAMFDYYCDRVGSSGIGKFDKAQFAADYARLGAQRNIKIVGIFVRLWKRDGKPRYLDMIPRVWAALERDLAHPALGPVAAWFNQHIPAELRDPAGVLGGKFAQ